MTVIYGSNASGKSGYARILKAACFTRSPFLEILGNIHLPEEKRDHPGATFVLGNGTSVPFKHGEQCPQLRDNFAVFDSSCIRVHTDEKNSFSVTPYLFDVFPAMVEVCDRVGKMLDSEIASTQPNTQQFRIENSTSEVADALNALSHETDIAELKDLATFGNAEEIKIAEIERKQQKLKSSDLAEVLKKMARQISDIRTLDGQLKAITAQVSMEVQGQAKEQIGEQKYLSDLAEATSAARFKAEPVQPVGSSAWQALIKGAIQFSDEAYPGNGFPPDSPDPLCVLCHQPLDDSAQNRLRRFFAFVASDTERKLTTVTGQLAAIRKQMDDLNFSIFGKDSGQCRTLEELKPDLATRVVEFAGSLKTVAGKVQTNIDGKAWVDLSVPANAVSPEMEALATKLDGTAEKLRKQGAEAIVKQISAELSQLKDRKFLTANFPELKKVVDTLEWRYRAEKALPIPHRHITEKQKALVKELVARGFEVEFN